MEEMSLSSRGTIEKLIKIGKLDGSSSTFPFSGRSSSPIQPLAKSLSSAFARSVAFAMSYTLPPLCRWRKTKQCNGSAKPRGEVSKESPG